VRIKPIVPAAALVAAGWAAAGVVVASTGTGPAQCTDPATHGPVIQGDAILNDGHEYVCTDGTLVMITGYGGRP
jgi:hypothetical protein